MSQFTVYANKNAKTRKTFPYLIDMQSDRNCSAMPSTGQLDWQKHFE